ncbi:MULTISPECIES: DUF3085 domain-containing protein [unclassified Mesorhizobium]|uniref:DUF3085 domain-containing protein n=1 Tax=unclassified Mesorhizobium TaxID=325217 RepID=UPI00112C9CBF|nr:MULTISPECIES: DUF3085 domain-containing protein [unclassified Mesorhizobium]MBZ9739779.1 DUF3085 domain-containing protein [Mesorhizobium sp. CO1-1-4]MBZ9804957.1 DUF3085 domain-containing protein [Mesorhizobium sp. ES1-6]TPL88702.1 DUF3085 domain-containing protein [Mesorhizobium sp. B2-3-12]
MFTFPIVAVRKVIERGKTDAVNNGGFRNPYYGLKPGEGEKPGLWLVGDEGVYLLSNGKLAEGQKAFICYAEECNPSINPDSWHYKRQYFGGDDGIEFIDAAEVLHLLDKTPDATHLCVQLTDTSISLTPTRQPRQH